MRNLPPADGGVETATADLVFADDSVRFIDGQGGARFVHPVLVSLDNFVCFANTVQRDRPNRSGPLCPIQILHWTDWSGQGGPERRL